MARRIVETVQEWDCCKKCPFFEWKYTGPDGFGERDTYEAGFCTKGHFGEVNGDFFGRTLYKKVQIPRAIPLYCEYSDFKVDVNMTLKQLVELGLNDNQILDFVDTIRKDLKDENNSST